MSILDGKACAAALRAELKTKIEGLPRKPGLAVVLVGDDPASLIYVRNKVRACEELEIRSYVQTLSENATQAELNATLDRFACDDAIDGVLLQLPLPKHLNAEEAIRHIPLEKDVDGFSAKNLGALLKNKPCNVACTPAGVMQLLEFADVELAGKHAVVLGRSETVGKPMALLLLNADATVTICHSKTKNLSAICREADILISAVGKANFVGADMVKEGAIVIDVGINRGADGKLCGDVDFAQVRDKAAWITPVPGGVGPMTIAMLMYNTYRCACKE